MKIFECLSPAEFSQKNGGVLDVQRTYLASFRARKYTRIDKISHQISNFYASLSSQDALATPGLHLEAPILDDPVAESLSVLLEDYALPELVVPCPRDMATVNEKLRIQSWFTMNKNTSPREYERVFSLFSELNVRGVCFPIEDMHRSYVSLAHRFGLLIGAYDIVHERHEEIALKSNLDMCVVTSL